MSTSGFIVITGSSSGFGYETARLLGAAGHRVFGTMRDVAGRNAEPARRLVSLGVDVVELDVTDDASVERAAARILDTVGRVDVLVNNAGTAHFGAAEAFTPLSFERQLATNLIGPFRVSRAFLPGMRENRSGLVVFLSSIAGRFVIPYTGLYTASKWAVEGLAEAFSHELRPFGIDVAIVEPGPYATNIGNVTVEPDDVRRLASYGNAAKGIETVGAALGARSGDPLEVARAIAALVAMPAGTRPLRTAAPAGSPIEAINEGTAPLQRRALEAYGLGPLLSPLPTAV